MRRPSDLEQVSADFWMGVRKVSWYASMLKIESAYYTSSRMVVGGNAGP